MKFVQQKEEQKHTYSFYSLTIIFKHKFFFAVKDLQGTIEPSEIFLSSVTRDPPDLVTLTYGLILLLS